MVGMMMGINYITYRKAQVFLDKITHSNGFIRKRQGINHNRPLWAGNDPSGHLSVNFALKPVKGFSEMRFVFACNPSTDKDIRYSQKQ